MELLTIGAFARASRLSPKALRLYDRLGLLRPARVDPRSGYRFYHPDQLERARLVAWLRYLGMPLARIRTVCDLPVAQAGAQIAAYWAQVEAETAGRRVLASFLVDHLSRKDIPVLDEPSGLAIRYAVRSDQGLVRPSNQDFVYAGERLLAVADGFGSPGEGSPASAVAIDALTPLDTVGGSADLLNALADAVTQADLAVRESASSVAASEAGTTLTAMLWSGSQLALVHIGDCRAYLLRDGELFQVTHDHTLVQSMVDAGSLTPEEAWSHPQRSILVRALGVAGPLEPDLGLREARAGDRYLLCSDGLHAVVPAEAIGAVLGAVADPDAAVDRLVELALGRGAPDNVSCVVADIVPAARGAL